ncbi:MAG: aspartate kinase [Ruminococcaceae bacterium]|nr:aspartate kinase [Oscillospiraceae bacterium]
MALKVVKFGGTSLADAEQFKRVADIIKSDPSRRYVVASAPGKRFKDDIKVTDLLYQCYRMIKNRENIDEIYAVIKDRYNGIIKDLGINFDISGELEYIKNAMLSHSGRDFAASRGEYINSIILAKYLGFDFIDAENVIFFKENGTFDEEYTNSMLAEELKLHEHAVIPGFYGSMPNGTIKTFSRGGSDVTGALVARAANADIYENWTDVSGMKMADPRIVNDPDTIETVTYRELRELSYMGASVLHEDAVFPVQKAGIPINIRNTNCPDEKGTMIVASTDNYDSKHVITGIAGKKGFTSITIEADNMNSTLGFGRRTLEILEENEVSFEHLPSGIDTMSIVLNTEHFEPHRDKVLTTIARKMQPTCLSVEDNLSLIAVVGRGMVKVKGTAAKIFDAISEADINIRMIDQGSSEINIIIAVEEHDFEAAVKAIYNKFAIK